MKRDRFLELRVLDGVHAGARAPLADTSQVLGAAADCDFVLTDAGLAAQHARIEVQADGSVLLHGLEGAAEPVRLAPGSGTSLGPVTVSVDWSDVPWQAESQAPVPGTADVADPAGTPVVAVVAPTTPPPSDLDATPALGTAQAATRATTTRPTRTAAVATTALAALVLAIAGGGVWWTLTDAPTEVTTVVALPAAAPGQRDAALSVVQQLGLADRVRVEMGAQGAVVHAGLLSDEEAESLAMALSRLSPRPGLRIANENDLQIAVADAIAREAAVRPWPVTSRYLGEGRFRIEGRTATAAESDQLLAALRAEFPQARGFESALVDQGEQAARMLGDLRQRGIGEVEGEWTGQQLLLTARVASNELPRWEQALLAAAGRHDVPFRATVSFSAQAAAPSGPAMPLRIRSIVSGEAGYVVLTDGTKLMTDGARDGWRVVSIQPQSVVFEGPQARRVVLTR